MNAAGRSELHMRRALLAALAAFGLVGLILTQTVVGRLAPISLPDWYWLVFNLSFLAPVVAAVIAAFVEVRWVRRLAGAAFFGVVVALALLLVIAIVDPGLEGQVPWLISAAGAAAGSAVIAWGMRAAWLGLGVITAMNWSITALVGDLTPHRVSNDIQALLFAVVTILLIGALVRGAHDIDRVTATSVRAAERRAAAQARRAAAERARTIVHDDVLGTLLQAARGSPELDRALAAPAAAAAARVRALAEPEASGAVPLTELRRHLAELARREVPGARVIERIGPGAPTELPVAAALAIADATRQALVNTSRHARGAAVTVALLAGRASVRVMTSDDGPGFDPALVGPDRLGISASILGRLRAVPGGTATVESAPGAGTVVTVSWQGGAEGGTAATSSVGAALAASSSGTAAAAERWALPADQLFALVLLLAAMTALAGYSSAIVDERWVPATAIVLVFAGLAVLGWLPLQRPSLPRALAAVVAAVLAASLVAAGDIADYRLMTGWYATAAAFVMMVLALRSRPFLSFLGTAAAIAVAGTASAVRGASLVDIVSVLFRPALIGIGVTLIVVLLAALARRVRRMNRAEVEAASAEAWREAEQAERQERWAGLDDLVGPMLDRLAVGRPLNAAERQECAILEGALRDRYRGARLAREPLVSAARRARARGVDVVLLDDAAAEHIEEGELGAIAHWMAALLDEVGGGTFTGRILPADRRGRASATSGEDATLFRGEEAFTRMTGGS